MEALRKVVVLDLRSLHEDKAMKDGSFEIATSEEVRSLLEDESLKRKL